MIMAHQHGVNNVVAALGTALGERHVRLLQRFADADHAGARRRRGGTAADQRNPGAVHCRSGQSADPDAARRARSLRFHSQQGADAFRELLDRPSMPWSTRLERSPRASTWSHIPTELTGPWRDPANHGHGAASDGRDATSRCGCVNSRCWCDWHGNSMWRKPSACETRCELQTAENDPHRACRERDSRHAALLTPTKRELFQILFVASGTGRRCARVDCRSSNCPAPLARQLWQLYQRAHVSNRRASNSSRS